MRLFKSALSTFCIFFCTEEKQPLTTYLRCPESQAHGQSIKRRRVQGEKQALHSANHLDLLPPSITLHHT
jgi:hypothetical protein